MGLNENPATAGMANENMRGTVPAPIQAPQGISPLPANNDNLRLMYIILFAVFFLGGIGFFIFQFATSNVSGNAGSTPTSSVYDQGRVGIDADAYATLTNCRQELRVYGADKAELGRIVANLSANNALAGINTGPNFTTLQFKDRKTLVNTAFNLKWGANANPLIPCTVTIDSKRYGIMVRWKTGGTTDYDKPWVLESEVSPFLPVGKPFNATCQAVFTGYSKSVRRNGRWTTDYEKNLTGILDLQAPGERYKGYKATGAVAPSPWASKISATIPNTAEINGVPYLLFSGAYPALDNRESFKRGVLTLYISSNISLEAANSTSMDVYMDLELVDGFAMANNFRLEK